MSDNGLKEISLICIPCPDQERAVDFYVGKLGFREAHRRAVRRRHRWIEVYPPDGTSGIALAPPPEGADAKVGIETGITITTDDVDATHAQLKDAGVDVDAEVSRYGDPVPPMFWLRDHDANVLMVVQAPSA